MLMGISDVLALAKTPEKREEMKARILRLMEMRDEDIDFSDMPPIRDFSRFKPLKPRVDAMREHNRKVKAERERQKEINESKVPE
ncbi:MAG: hypothetical protein IJP97_07055 [Synergistaceae bacterium]|nr:hypothetical protein [Synergistaceae bacterium]MBR0070236.1 hypothetical protein [Synergistaceae bacterium]